MEQREESQVSKTDFSTYKPGKTVDEIMAGMAESGRISPAEVKDFLVGEETHQTDLFDVPTDIED